MGRLSEELLEAHNRQNPPGRSQSPMHSSAASSYGADEKYNPFTKQWKISYPPEEVKKEHYEGYLAHAKGNEAEGKRAYKHDKMMRYRVEDQEGRNQITEERLKKEHEAERRRKMQEDLRRPIHTPQEPKPPSPKPKRLWEAGEKCPVCMEPLQQSPMSPHQGKKLPCGHLVCKQCLTAWHNIKHGRNKVTTCPLCRKPIPDHVAEGFSTIDSRGRRQAGAGSGAEGSASLFGSHRQGRAGGHTSGAAEQSRHRPSGTTTDEEHNSHMHMLRQQLNLFRDAHPGEGTSRHPPDGHHPLGAPPGEGTSRHPPDGHHPPGAGRSEPSASELDRHLRRHGLHHPGEGPPPMDERHPGGRHRGPPPGEGTSRRPPDGHHPLGAGRSESSSSESS